jgi:hypothetical protein
MVLSIGADPRLDPAKVMKLIQRQPRWRLSPDMRVSYAFTEMRLGAENGADSDYAPCRFPLDYPPTDDSSMRILFPLCLATLLVLVTTCETAHFVHRSDSSVAGQAGGGGGTSGVGGAAGGNRGTGGNGSGGTGGTLCQLSTQACSGQPGQSSTIPCDPVCQSGTCPCGKKCSYAGPDATTVCAGQGPQTESESCTVTYSGSSNQLDDCTPGNICLAPGSGLQAYCFRLCYQDSDCRSYADCSQRPLSSSGGLVSVCSPAHKLCGSSDSPCCDPLDASNNPCPSANPVCYLVAPDALGHSRTVCEYSSGGLGENSTTACSSSRECMASLACADADHRCHRVCDPSNPVCPTGTHCTSWGIEYGYCI